MTTETGEFLWPKNGRISTEDASSGVSRPFVAYVHVPFCQTKCGYCDFNSYVKGFGVGADLETYADSVISEIEQSAHSLREAMVPTRPLQSIFFGGGTPSLLDPIQLGRIVDALKNTFGLSPLAEVTLESNPETVTAERFEGFACAGVNRVSIGMQSAVPNILKVLGRTHDPKKVGWTVQTAKNMGFRVSLDLIYGAPTETLCQWHHSLQTALEMEPEHLSAYSLIVEPGTKMATQIRRGELPKTDSDLEADKYQLTSNILENEGYEWYEISNFAKNKATQSTHNLAYWRNWDWWGYGAGAHSHIGCLRWWNVTHPSVYAAKLAGGASAGAAGERLTEGQQRLEQLMLAIRTRDGVSRSTVSDSVDVDGLISRGLLENPFPRRGKLGEEPRLVLTVKGRLLADYVTRVLVGWEK